MVIMCSHAFFPGAQYFNLHFMPLGLTHTLLNLNFTRFLWEIYLNWMYYHEVL